MSLIYLVPHAVHDFSLTKTELYVLIVLFKIRSDFQNEKGGYFYATNKKIAALAKVSVKSVKRAKSRLYEMELVKYWSPDKKNRNQSKFKFPG